MTTTQSGPLLKQGYSVTHGGVLETRLPELFTPGFRQIVANEINELEADENHLTHGRFRRHGKALLFPEDHQIRFLKPQGNAIVYNQGRYNPEYSHPRRLSPLSHAFLSEAAVNSLIWHDFRQTDWNGYDLSFPLCVGLSIIRFHLSEKASQDAKIGATPNTLHQDGEVFTFAHLLEHNNVDGGYNYISTPGNCGKHPSVLDKKDILATFRLESYFDSYAIFDPRVSHHVDEISPVKKNRETARTVLLIDFTPMKLIHQ